MKKYKFMAILGIVSIWLLACVKSFVFTTGMIWLICLCFEISFTIKWATGIWLILILVSYFLKSFKDE